MGKEMKLRLRVAYVSGAGGVIRGERGCRGECSEDYQVSIRLNWWVGLPDPMLMVYGEGLKDATITVKGPGAKLVKAQVSDNGHYAFLWVERK